MPGLQQEITIPGTKKKVPLKVILLGGAALLILFLLSRRQSGQSTAAPSEDGLLAEEYNQRLQDQYNAMSGLIGQGQTQPTEPITAPLDEMRTIPGGETVSYTYPDATVYGEVPPVVAYPETAVYAPEAAPEAAAPRNITMGSYQSNVRTRLPTGEIVFTKSLEKTPRTAEEIAALKASVKPTNYLVLRGEKTSAEKKAAVTAATHAPASVANRILSQVGVTSIDTLSGKPTHGTAPASNRVTTPTTTQQRGAARTTTRPTTTAAKPKVTVQVRKPAPKPAPPKTTSKTRRR